MTKQESAPFSTSPTAANTTDTDTPHLLQSLSGDPTFHRKAAWLGGVLLVALFVLLLLFLWLPVRSNHPHDPRVRLRVTSPMRMNVGLPKSPEIRLWKQSLWSKTWDERPFVLQRYRIRISPDSPQTGLSWQRWHILAQKPGIYRVTLHVQSLPWLSFYRVDLVMPLQVVVLP